MLGITKVSELGLTSKGDIKLEITLNSGSIYRATANMKRNELNSGFSEVSAPNSMVEMDKEVDFILESEGKILQGLSNKQLV